jgi:hypothetical protein
MHCCDRNIERLTRIPKLRTDLQSRFVACSFQPLKSAIHELAIWPGPLLAVLSAINNGLPDSGKSGRIPHPASMWQVGLYADGDSSNPFQESIGPQLVR